jgi:hypothetical protein
LWASDRSLVEIETDIMNGQQIRPVDESKYNIYRTVPPDVAGEQSWFGLGETMLGVLIRDPADHDYGGVVLVRDDIGRFRMVDAFASKPTPDIAVHSSAR